jgi:hypothetical protein
VLGVGAMAPGSGAVVRNKTKIRPKASAPINAEGHLRLLRAGEAEDWSVTMFTSRLSLPATYMNPLDRFLTRVEMSGRMRPHQKQSEHHRTYPEVTAPIPRVVCGLDSSLPVNSEWGALWAWPGFQPVAV